MEIRVDNVPAFLRPGFQLWGECGGLSLYASLRVLRRSLSVEVRAHPDIGDQPAIFAIWHENLVPLFLSMPALEHHRYQIWMNHPLWYMKPVHVFLRYLGVRELCLGSTGHHGQAALAQLGQRLLETGASTSMAVDGPKGPPYQLRKGCLYLARATGYPLVPLRFSLSKGYRLPFNWDRKWWPQRHASITVHIGQPLLVDSNTDLRDAARELSSLLNEPTPSG